jgi:hypothetical protein
MKNRAKIGAVNFILEMVIGILTEWQRANREGTLDFNVKKDVENQVNQKQMVDPTKFNH